MKLTGEWLDHRGDKQSGKMHAWGEWEPESKVIHSFERNAQFPYSPRYLWEPFWVPRKSYIGVHNTDPFIFGNCFFYSNCRQTSKGGAGLKNLDIGSVIVFGSGKKVYGERKWVLDTVFVVKDYIDYNPLNPLKTLKDEVPNEFIHVAIKPLSENLGHVDGCVKKSSQLRLYRGATPDSRVNGMYSFFPAIPEDSNRSAFSRPAICLNPRYFNCLNTQAPKGSALDSPRTSWEVLYELWDSLVCQTKKAGLVLGTFAQIPNQRNQY